MTLITQFPLGEQKQIGSDTSSFEKGRGLWMPPKSPLEMPTQDFSQKPAIENPRDAELSKKTVTKRSIVFSLPLALTLLSVGGLGALANHDGITHLETLWLFLILVSFLWIAFTFFSTISGLKAANATRTHNLKRHQKLNVAIIAPVFNESPLHVFGNINAMQRQLQALKTDHSFAFFVLSDTQDPDIARLEENAMLKHLASQDAEIPVFYRRRDENIDRKTGNVRQWISNWGGAYDAFVILDADSLISGVGIVALADELSSDASLALVQTCPRLFGANTFLGRMQQFAGATYGNLPAKGEAGWSGNEANYHGHNAIVRTKAFAQNAGLPHLKRRNGSHTMIYSHDFVEAALLRRAGWGVRMMPEMTATFEETPATLIDYILRDRRWCQGNMQHISLLNSAGFHPISRFHLGKNALTYLMSPAWFVLILIGVLLGTPEFSLTQALFGIPSSNLISLELFQGYGAWFLALVATLLLGPKFLGMFMVLANKSKLAGYGGLTNFVRSFLSELVFTIVLAPVLMVHQTKTIVSVMLGNFTKWAPAKRYDSAYSFVDICSFHREEFIVGGLLVTSMSFNVVSWWLLPVGFSLLLAPVLSVVSGISFEKNRMFLCPDESSPPAVIEIANAERQKVFDTPQDVSSGRVAAE